MSDFTFRIRFSLFDNVKLPFKTHHVDLLDQQNRKIRLYGEKDKKIDESKTIWVKGWGYSSENEAVEAGEKLRNDLTLTFFHCHIGADFGERSLRVGFFTGFLKELEKEKGVEIKNEVPGLVVYETSKNPLFASIGAVTMTVQRSCEDFVSFFENCHKMDYEFDERERLSYSLFANSFDTKSQDAKLIFLVIAVEILLEQQPRPQVVIEYAKSFIDHVKKSTDIPDNEKDSIIGTINMLRKESIGQGCCRIIESELGNKIYNDLPASVFFKKCYNLRSALVHGSVPYPDRSEVSVAAANLERLVSDLLTIRIN